MSKKDPLKIVTSSHVVSYVHLKEPTAFEEGGKAKYDLTILIPKDHPDVDKINEAIDHAYEMNKESVFKGKRKNHPKLHNPLRDGDEWLEDHPEAVEYEGKYFLRASSVSQPKAYDEDGNDIFDMDEIYSGAICRVSLRCFPFNNVAFGFGFYLNSVKKTADGERLGGFTASHEDFEDEDDAPKKAKPTAKAKPAPKAKPKAEYAEDEDGNDIVSYDGGETWEYVE